MHLALDTSAVVVLGLVLLAWAWTPFLLGSPRLKSAIGWAANVLAIVVLLACALRWFRG